MGQKAKIAIRECADLGPVIARADHLNNAVEVNARIFYGLPPLVQEFVLCHEACHLKYGEHDEGRTNLLASQLFMSRAKNDADRRVRADFLAYMDGKEYSEITVAAIVSIVSAAIGAATTIYGTVKDRNALWYSWDDATKRANLKAMLTQAFEESRKTSRESAAQLFWQQMYSYTNKDDDLDEFLSRSDNAWVRAYIAKYEAAYGFGFEEVTPIDITAYPLAIVTIGAVVGYIVYRIIKNRMK